MPMYRIDRTQQDVGYIEADSYEEAVILLKYDAIGHIAWGNNHTDYQLTGDKEEESANTNDG